MRKFVFCVHQIWFFNSFEEAFALLIREIETIKRDNLSRNNSITEKPNKTKHRPHGTGFSSIERVNSLRGMHSLPIAELSF